MRRAIVLLAATAMLAAAPVFWATQAPHAIAVAWWIWPLALFVVSFLLGIVAVPAGVGGGVLFVPIVGGFFPFHLDYVRGAGLLVALASSLSAGPQLLRLGLSNLRLLLPLALFASISSIGGAMLGLALPPAVLETALGITILGIVVLMAAAKRSEFPGVPQPDRLSIALGMHGIFHDFAAHRDIAWKVHRTPQGILLFIVIGVLGGMFGLGAGWANLPTLNLVMGVPLKLAAGTSSFLPSLVNATASWVYINRGAVLPMIAVPSVIGMMLGAKIGTRLLRVMPAAAVRKLVLVLLAFAGLRTLLQGLDVWA